MSCLLRCMLWLVLLLPAFTCAQGAPTARVSALANGRLLLNGKPADFAAIDSEFQRLKPLQGSVWYHRENAHTEPPPQAMAVVKLIIKHQLPVTLSTQPDFSDYVDAEGRSRPRKP